MNDEPWSEDRLGRRADGEHLIKVLLERFEARRAAGTGSYILNIDAPWGQGKSFFLKNLRAHLQRRGYVVGSVNAWKDDHASDPLVTVMAAVEDELAPFFRDNAAARTAFETGKRALGTVASETAKQVGLHLLKTVTGVAVDKTIARLSEEGLLGDKQALDRKAFDDAAEGVWEKGLEALLGERLSEHRKANDGIATFRQRTAEAIAAVVGNGMLAPMFVFVDELDRCRPLYAIRLLEDVKHLFDIDGLVFVVATDSSQLAHSVRAIYGAEFEARKYLRRFFDRVFVFPEASRRDFLAATFEAQGISPDETFFHLGETDPLAHAVRWADQLELSNRDITQIVEVLATFTTSFEHPCRIELNYLLALATAFYEADSATFEALAAGTAVDEGRFARWSIRAWSLDRSSGTRQLKDVNAGDVLSQAVRQAKLGLFRLHADKQQHDTLFWPYFYKELTSRFPGGYRGAEDQTPVLLEYPSRVSNAGRVIDRST